jgi:hypothetical protein
MLGGFVKIEVYMKAVFQLLIAGLIVLISLWAAKESSAQSAVQDIGPDDMSAAERSLDDPSSGGVVHTVTAPADPNAAPSAAAGPRPAADKQPELTETSEASEPPQAPPPPSPEPTVKIGGAVIAYYRHPFIKSLSSNPSYNYPYKDSFEIYRGIVTLDSKLNRFGLHLDFRIRDTKLKSFFAGTAWVEEAYGFGEIMQRESPYGPLVLKVGKIYQQFGRFWDNSFFGNVHLRDGLKLDPNFGLSLEGDLLKDSTFGLKYFIQFFVIDGGTNSSNPGRDTFSATVTAATPVEGATAAHRRNMAIGRIEPFVKAGKLATFKLGLSGEYFSADLPNPVSTQDVTRFAGDVTVQLGPAAVWAEYIMSDGITTTDFPFAATAEVAATATTPAVPATAARFADGANYLLVGGQVTYSLLTLRYNYSQGDYLDVLAPTRTMYMDYLERTHVPSLSVKVTDYLLFMAEFTIWETVASVGGFTSTTTTDKSLLISMHGRI